MNSIITWIETKKEIERIIHLDRQMPHSNL